MASGFYNKPPVIVPNEGPEGAGGKPGKTGAPTTGLTGRTGAHAGHDNELSTLSGGLSTKAANRAATSTSGGGAPQTLNVPRGFQNNPMAALAATFAANASPTMNSNCATLGTLIAARDPSKAGPVCDALLSARIVNGEVVIPPVDIGEPPATTGPASTAAADTAAPAVPVAANSTPASPQLRSPRIATPVPAMPIIASSTASGGGAYGVNVVAPDSDDQAIQNMGVMPPGGDISEMCYVVLMNATNDQDKDLELIMATTKAQTAAKQALRTLIANVGRDVAANAAQQVDDANRSIRSRPTRQRLSRHRQRKVSTATGNCAMPVPDPNARGTVTIHDQHSARHRRPRAMRYAMTNTTT